MTPDEYCQQKAAASGSSFYYSFLFLPSERRRAITALYAFCREVDDIVDEVSDVGEDARRGRVYLPQDELARFGLTPEDILERKGGEPFVKLMRFQSERAQSYYDL